MDPFLLVLIVGAVFFLWLSFSRARKQQQTVTAFRDSLAPGQEVMTSSGLFGTVVEVTGDRVRLEVAPGVVTEWLLQAIRNRVEPPFAEDDAAEGDEEEPGEGEPDARS